MAKNTHLEHIEDDIVNSGKAGGINAIRMLRSLGDMLTEPQSSVKITTKWDGLPAVVCGIDPKTGYFFVGKKSVFNKIKPVICYSEKHVDKVYGNKPDLAKVLKLCYKHLSKLGISGVIQGDFLYTADTKSLKQVGGEECITFKPNEITYAIPTSNPIATKVKGTKMGIVFHTAYEGPSLADMNAVYGVPDIPGNSDVAIFSSTFADASSIAKFTSSESDTYKRLVNRAEGSLRQASPFLNQITEHGTGQFQTGSMFKVYINTFYRDATLSSLPNTQTIKSGFVSYYANELNKKITSVSTQSAKDKWTAVRDDGIKFLTTNDNFLKFTVASYLNIIEAKEYVIMRLNKVESEVGTFFQDGDGYQVTSPEGFVAISSGSALKLVSRMIFSRRNFTAAKDWKKG